MQMGLDPCLGTCQHDRPGGIQDKRVPLPSQLRTTAGVVDNTLKNATAANLTEDGQKIEGNLPGVPFPIPQSGLEVMWNHMIRQQEDYSYKYDVYYVSSDGKPILSTTGDMVNIFPAYQKGNRTNVQQASLLHR